MIISTSGRNSVSIPGHQSLIIGVPQAAADRQADAEVPTISVTELKRRLDVDGRLLLVDVRETYERDIAQVPGAKGIPLGELPARMSELDSAQEIALLCKNGQRSAQAVRSLQEAGFSKLFNVSGGIDAWSQQIDSTVPKY